MPNLKLPTYKIPAEVVKEMQRNNWYCFEPALLGELKKYLLPKLLHPWSRRQPAMMLIRKAKFLCYRPFWGDCLMEVCTKYGPQVFSVIFSDKHPVKIVPILP